MRIVFMGTAELACDSLKALSLHPQFELITVVTQPDRPRGRELKLLPPPVKKTALALNLPVLQPERARDPSFIASLATLKPDAIVVVAYGQILPPSILSLPRYGCLNVHTSLLPKYRGAAPIQFAVLNDDPTTGVTIMSMDEGMDTGPILTQTTTPILPGDTAQTLHDRLAQLGGELLTKTLADLPAGTITPRPQNPSEASYTRKITKEDGRIDWNQPARAVWNQIRAFTPWPGAFTTRPAPGHPGLLKIWEASVVAELSGPPGAILKADKTGLIIGCASQALQVEVLQLEGRRRMAAADFLAGTPLHPDDLFQSAPPHNFSPVTR